MKTTIKHMTHKVADPTSDHRIEIAIGTEDFAVPVEAGSVCLSLKTDTSPEVGFIAKTDDLRAVALTILTICDEVDEENRPCS